MKENEQILESWKVNSHNWINSIDNKKIESRNLVTNQAIIEIIKKYNPKNILDLGCGEGWLTRELAKNNYKVIGIDGTNQLIENARSKGGQFFHITYEEIIEGKKIPSEPFEAIIINFALFDQNETEKLLKKLQQLLTKDSFEQKVTGKIFIQTLHPYNLIASGQYKSKWETNSWDGLSGNYTDPHHWYNRTLEDWIKVFTDLNYSVTEIKEPLNPNTNKPQSIIFVLSKINH